MTLVNLSDVEAAARGRLPHETYDYCAGGAHDEISVRENHLAYDRLSLRPRVLIDVSRCDLSTTVLGEPIAAPILVAPMAFQRMLHPDGEVATARAAAATGCGMLVSTLSTTALEDIRVATSAPLWFQLYVHKDRGATRALVERAERAGYTAIVVTVDVPRLGGRERDVRNRFRLPSSLAMARTELSSAIAAADAPQESELATYFANRHDASLTWRDVAWLRSITRLPVLLKGIVRGDDAAIAVEHGVAAVVVSNHGGRQLDTAIPTIVALRDVVDAIEQRIEVLIDGGIRRGTDVLKAIALGARAVLVGRPVLWGLAVDGEEGVALVLRMLRDELDLAMSQCGCPSIAHIGRDLVAT